MRYIEFGKIAQTVESLCISAGYELPEDVLIALEEAAQKESNPTAAKFLISSSKMPALRKMKESRCARIRGLRWFLPSRARKWPSNPLPEMGR